MEVALHGGRKRFFLAAERSVYPDGGFRKKTQEKGLVRFGAEGSAAGLFQKKKRNRPFALAVLFTSLKLLIVAFVVLCFAGLGLAFGIGKAYIDTAPTLDVAQLTISDRTSFCTIKTGNS